MTANHTVYQMTEYELMPNDAEVSTARVKMRRSPLQQEVVDLIAFYESRGWDWTDAVHFTLTRANNELWQRVMHPRNKFTDSPAGRPRKIGSVTTLDNN